MRIWQRLRDVVVNRILGLDDSPQRIARGVFLGFVVAMTPTLGLQIVIYVTLATALRVNKVAGVPILFITNPVTAVPLYGFCWWLGNLVLHAGAGDSSWAEVQERLMAGESTSAGMFEQLLSAAFWSRVGDAMAQLGGELWLGSLISGVALGVPAYALSLWGVRAYRRHALHANPDRDDALGGNERVTTSLGPRGGDERAPTPPDLT